MNELDNEIYKTYHGHEGDYTITEKQWEDRHEGGMGFVCTGKTVNSPQKEVIIKTALPSSLHIEALQKEAYVLRSIKDEIKTKQYSIVNYIDEAKPPYHKADFFLVMEHLGNESLADKIGTDLFNQKLDEKTVKKFSKEIARSLGFLHKCVQEREGGRPMEVGIIHRDLKPLNLMIVKRGNEEHCIMIDFGTGKRNWKGGGPTITKEIGTRGYSCPHQFAGLVSPDPPGCDLYALGRVMFYMATGEDPVEHTNLDGSMKIKANEKGVRYDLSELIDELISHPNHTIAEKELVERLEMLPDSSASQSPTVASSKFTAPKSQFPLEPHIILGTERFPIKNGRCELGREHKCPEIEEWSRKKVKPDCSRGVIHRDMSGFKWPIGLTSRKNQTNIPLPLTPMGNSSEPKSIADAHHMRIWKKDGKWVVMDLDTDAWSGYIRNGRWYRLLPLNPRVIDEDFMRLAIGFTIANGPEIEFTFYKQ